MTFTWTNTPTAKWQAQQDELGAHILQSSAWSAFQQALGHTTFHASGCGWGWLAVLEKRRFLSRLYCPYGPVFDSPEALQEALQALQACAKANGAAYVRIEPQGSLEGRTLTSLGLVPAHRTIQPRYTWIKDLRSPETTLLAEMTTTNRNLYRTAANKGLRFRASTNPADIELFLPLMHEVAGRNGITIHPDNYYRLMAKTLMPLGALTLYIAEADGQPVAASLALDSPTTRYYAHAAASGAARKLQPANPLLAHMIFEAKKRGQTRFDFYGIAPPNQPNHPWAGFTKFKQAFGGHAVNLGGTWELGIKHWTYLLYSTFARII